MKAVIARDDKILVLREASTYKEGTNIGRYHFPGGRIEPGEPFAEGLLREVREETGLEVALGEPLYVGEWFPVIREVPNHIVAMFITCQITIDKPIVLSDEHDDYQWVSREEARQLNFMAPDDEVAETFFKRLVQR
jgi:8-oxo-dGTP diphosphatase